MNCQSCQKHAATVRVIEPVYHEDGSVEVRRLQLCPPCAKAAGVPIEGTTSYPKVVSMLGKILLPAAKGASGKSLACPDCGWTLRDFRQTSRFGCPKDYDVFGKFITQFFERIHGATEHPFSPEEASLGRLRKELGQAVEKEDYEMAARLRDQIQSLESSLEIAEENPEKTA